MGTIIVVFLLLVGLPVAAGVAIAARPLSSPKLIRRGAIGAFAVGFVLSAALLAFKSYHPIGAGRVGIVYGPSGSIVGQMNAGGFLVPWDTVKTARHPHPARRVRQPPGLLQGDDRRDGRHHGQLPRRIRRTRVG